MMRTHLFAVIACGLAIGLVVARPTPGLGQMEPRASVPGMFGNRVLRQPVGPMLSPSQLGGSGLARSPSGAFLGRNANAGSLMFPAMPWQYQGPEAWPPGVVPLATLYQGLVPTPAAPQRPVQPAPMPQQAPPTEGEAGPAMIPELPATVPGPAAPAGPDQWLRTMGGMAPAPAGASSPAATGPTAVASPAGTAPTAGSAPAAPAAAPAPRPMPPPIQLGFAPPRSSEDAGTAVTQLLGRIPQIEKRSAITVSLENGTAVLRGRVATERDRMLAEDIVRFDPGIWNVRNELVVEGQPPPAAKPSSR